MRRPYFFRYIRRTYGIRMTVGLASSSPKGGRPANPTPKWNAARGVWVVRVTVNGSQEPHDLPGIDRDDTSTAKRVAKLVSDRLRRGEGGRSDGRETVASWAQRRYRWLAGRRRAVTLEERQRRWVRWIDPILGSLPITDVTDADIRRVVRVLEDAVAGESIRPKTAQNIWGEVTKAFADACEVNDDAIRVLRDNPCDKVRGPEKGDIRQKPFLRPVEVVTLLSGTPVDPSASAVPRYRRELYALAVYTGARIGELRALTRADVDLDRMQISIAKQADRFGTEKGRTKTGRARAVSIEPPLVPLLRILIDRGGQTLLEVHNEDHARLLREDLATVGCTRAELFADDEQRAPLTFHGLRDTCLTHMAVRRDPPQDVQWRAGHTSPLMTERYIGGARLEAGTHFGTPFPPLPDTLLTVSEKSRVFQIKAAKFSKNSCEGRELNPYRNNPAGT